MPLKTSSMLYFSYRSFNCYKMADVKTSKVGAKLEPVKQLIRSWLAVEI
jgi:hypothetical protein